jgi:hypothetical protein
MTESALTALRREALRLSSLPFEAQSWVILSPTGEWLRTSSQTDFHESMCFADPANVEELGRVIPRLEGEVARRAHEARRAAFEKDRHAYRARHAAHLACVERLEAHLTAMLADVEQAACLQQQQEQARRRLYQEMRGLDITELGLPSSLPPWMAWAMAQLSQRVALLQVQAKRDRRHRHRRR